MTCRRRCVLKLQKELPTRERTVRGRTRPFPRRRAELIEYGVDGGRRQARRTRSVQGGAGRTVRGKRAATRMVSR